MTDFNKTQPEETAKSNKVKFTPTQQEAIDINKENCLIAAAAGSGKTAVLSNRVVRLLTDDLDPVDVNEIIVATYTKAAAKEMIHRIGNVLTEKIDELKEQAKTSDDALITKRIEHLELQKLQLPNARISTIDSLCKSLVQENFQSLEIAGTTQIADTTQIDLLEKEVTNDLLDELHSNPNTIVTEKDYKDLIEFTCNKNDDDLITLLLKTHNYIRSFPAPLEYLDKVLQDYTNAGAGTLEDNIWTESIFSHIEDIIDYCIQSTEYNITLAQSCPVVEANYKDAFEVELAHFKLIKGDIENKKYIDAFDKIRTNFWGKLKTKQGVDVDTRDLCKFIRDKIKKIINDIPKKYGAIFTNDYKQDIAVLQKHITTFFTILKALYHNIEAKKRELEIMDFANVEHYMLDLLTQKNKEGVYLKDSDGEFVKSETATALSKQFKYILVDECQDINRVQNTIFNLLSDNEENIYMVGDVKQSIYRFRKAAPELFIEKKENSTKTKTILLQENFRSRDVVCNTINHIFEQLMSKQIGDINYDDTEKLISGRTNYFENPKASPELHIIDCVDGELVDQSNILEAKYIAQIIEDMVSKSYQVFDGDQTSRNCNYGDFTILVRNKKDFKEIYQEAFAEKGIPFSCDFKSEFLSEYEITTAINLIKVINNPLQDIPLLSVIMSPLFGFSPDLVSLIKMKTTDKLWNAIINFSNTELDTEVDTTDSTQETKIELDPATQKEYELTCRNFIDLIAVFREKASILTTSKLMQFIFDSTDFLALMSGKIDINQVKTNINYLLNYSKSYDNFNGITGFINYIDSFIENKDDLTVSNTLLSDANTVKLMTIHGSKGLEFPICIVSNCAKQFNKMDLSQKYIFDNELGFSTKIVSNNKYKKHTPLSYRAIALKKEKDGISEELRVLYVALTRAKEKLIMIGSYKNAEKTIQSIVNFAPGRGAITPYEVFSHNKFCDWLVASLLRKEDLVEIVESNKIMIDQPLSNNVRFKLINSSKIEDVSCESTKEEIVTASTQVEVDSNLVDTITEQLNYSYPNHELTITPAKTTVTKLAKSNFAQETTQSITLDTNLTFDSAVSSDKTEFTPAQKGDILHKFMQYADYSIASTKLEEEISRLVQENYLTQSESDVLERGKITKFFESDMYQLMTENEVKREFTLNFHIDANEVNPNLPPNQSEIFLQGIADCLILQKDSVIILDYKTDRTTDSAELVKRYKRQMELYSKAIQEIFGKPTQAYLFSLSMGKSIEVEL